MNSGQRESDSDIDSKTGEAGRQMGSVCAQSLRSAVSRP